MSSLPRPRTLQRAGAETSSPLFRLAFLVMVPLVLTAGALAPLSVPAALLLVGGATSLLLVTRGPWTANVFMALLFVLLAGYAVMGKGLAHLGVPPIYVGELVLGLGVVAGIATWAIRRPTGVHIIIVGFMAWGAYRTLPYAPTYGFDAFRDAVTWGYASFALIVSLIVNESHLRILVRWYGRLAWLLVVWIPIFAVAWFTHGSLFPTLPGSDVSIPYFKGGDMAVHLAGLGGFALAGLLPPKAWRSILEPIFWLLWIAAAAAIAAINRGGMLALMLAAPAALLVSRAFGRLLLLTGAAVIVLAVLAVASVQVDLETRQREVSLEQVSANIGSVFGESSDAGLAGTREWRERWWSTVIDYTLGGDYFWTGKGYGINLAEDDGFLGRDPQLRAPHNAHIQFLARGGVPNLLLWVATQVAFAAVMLKSALRTTRARNRWLTAIHAWILAYWLAMIVNMSFDVYLEGPQGGILFWSIVGLGLAVAAISRDTPMPSVQSKSGPAA